MIDSGCGGGRQMIFCDGEAVRRKQRSRDAPMILS